MAISPLTPGAFRSTNAARLLTDTRLTLDDLQRQLATGKKSETFGGLGAARITSLEMRAKLSEVRGYQATITSFQIRAKQLDLGLNQLGKISDEVRSATILPQFNPDSTGKTSMQKYARTRFDEAVDVLNTEINGVRLFSGRTTDVRPVLDANTLLVGDSAGRAGVQQLIAERKAADFGVAGSPGRVVQGGGGATATLTEDGAHPFGFKLTAASSTSAGIATALTAGPPANISFTITANPVDGDQVRFELTMADGSKQAIALNARTGPLTPAGDAGNFEIGATPAATGANLRLAIAAVMNREATTSLPAASAKAAAAAFFAGSTNNPPLRVSGPPATATALVAGTAANTVIWYQGDDQSPSARFTAQAKVDTSVTVGVGVQANEEGIRRVMTNLAVFASETFNASNPADQGRYQAMSDRMRADLGQTTGVQRVQDIQVEIALSATTMKLADERHRTKVGFVENILGDVEDINQEETAARLLSLQTKLQAAYQTTAIISRLNLTDYLR
jgi:flagellar hook-associated protein 3 FlgL